MNVVQFGHAFRIVIIPTPNLKNVKTKIYILVIIIRRYFILY